MMQRRAQDGHALALVIVALTVLMITTVGLAQLAERAADQARARTAADAVALAAASGGPSAGRRLAAANHAVLIALDWSSGTVRATVRVGMMSASASATLVPAS